MAVVWNVKNAAWYKLALLHHADICHSSDHGTDLSMRRSDWSIIKKLLPYFVTENDKLQQYVLSAPVPIQAVQRLQLHHGGHERPQVRTSLTCKSCKTVWAGPTASPWCPRCGPPCSSAWPTSTLSRWLGQGMVWLQYQQVLGFQSLHHMKIQ